MNPNQFIPFFMVLTAPQQRQARLAEAMFPALLPVAPAQQAAISAISANIQVDTEFRRVDAARAEEAAKGDTLFVESAEVIKIFQGKNKGEKLTPAELDNPKLRNFKAALEKRPDLIDVIVTKP